MQTQNHHQPQAQQYQGNGAHQQGHPSQAQTQAYQQIVSNASAAISTNGIYHGPDSNHETATPEEQQRVLNWIAELMRDETREAALLELIKKRESVSSLALILWHSFGNQEPHHTLS